MPSETILARAGAAAIWHETLARGLDRPVAGVQAGRLRIGFVMEKILGHVTWYQNLRRAVEALDTVDARWVETTLYDSQGRLERVPGLPAFARAGARAWLDVHRGLRGRPCDVLLFNTQKAAMLCQWDMLRTPTMLMTDVTPIQYDRLASLYDHEVDENPVVRTLKHQANVLNFHLARALVPCSTWTRDSMIRDYGVPPERVHVVPIGADTDYWRPAVRRPSGGPVRLLFVGGHFERKGGQLLFDVFRALRLAERAELHVVTRDVVAAAPGVVVHRNLENNTPELLRLYQEADAFVLPTLADCFSNASIEAMATGLPVITTAMGGIPDIVEHGATGYLLAPNDGRQLGEALRRVVEDTSHRVALGAAGRARALARFDARTNVARILELARAISTNGSPPSSKASHRGTPRTGSARP
jgi:glycosyltransferase involved in cell wall biosynthesis